MLRFARRRKEENSEYSPLSIQSEDDTDTVCLLSPSKPTLPRRRRRRFRGLFMAIRRTLRRRRQKQPTTGVHFQSYSAATSPISSVPTGGQHSPAFMEQSLHPVGSHDTPTPMYCIISDVSSDAMREELESRVVRNLSEQWNDEEEYHNYDDDADADDDDEQGSERKGRSCVRLGKLSWSRCFVGHPPRNVHDYDEKEVETIPMSIEDDQLSVPFDEESSFSSFSSIEPPPSDPSSSRSSDEDPYESFSSTHPTQCYQPVALEECLSFHSSYGQEQDMGDENWADEHSADRRDDSNTKRQVATTRECVRLLFPPPAMPFSNIQSTESVEDPAPLLGVTFPHPGASRVARYQDHPTLGIHSAHPHWIKRKETNFWDQVDPDPLDIDDEDSLFRTSPIEVGTWTSNMWLAQPSDSMESPVEHFTAEQPDENFAPDDTHQEPNHTSPMEWTRKLYQPFFHFAKDITTCGRLGDASFDEAPFDEIQNDLFDPSSLGDVTNTVYTRRKTRCHRLKPSPKDSPPMAWFRDVAMKGHPLWRDFQL